MAAVCLRCASYNVAMREFDLLRHVFAANAQLPPRVTLPPGDDMGALRFDGRDVLVTVDQLADGVHVDLRSTSLSRVGRKAVTRNLSDIAAMAAQPRGGVVSVCLPRAMTQEQASELLDAARKTAAEHDCPIFGGDVSVWDHPLLMSVTLLAEPAGIEPVKRSGARVGDFLCVTGQLGGSLLEIARDSQPYTHHLDFTPRLSLARQLASHAATRPSSMIDISDGLARDVRHLCEMSGVSTEIWAGQLPISPAAMLASTRSSMPAWWHALCDGEDYELLLTVTPSQREKMPEAIEGVPITVVGVMTAAADPKHPTVLLRLPDGSAQPVGDWGWEHQTSKA